MSVGEGQTSLDFGLEVPFIQLLPCERKYLQHFLILICSCIIMNHDMISPRRTLTLCDRRGAALYAGHGEEEDGVGVGAARGVFTHPLLSLQGLAPGDQENLQQPRGDVRFRRQEMMNEISLFHSSRCLLTCFSCGMAQVVSTARLR